MLASTSRATTLDESQRRDRHVVTEVAQLLDQSEREYQFGGPDRCFKTLSQACYSAVTGVCALGRPAARILLGDVRRRRSKALEFAGSKPSSGAKARVISNRSLRRRGRPALQIGAGERDGIRHEKHGGRVGPFVALVVEMVPCLRHEQAPHRGGAMAGIALARHIGVLA